jgi:hypothetical protein
MRNAKKPLRPANSMVLPARPLFDKLFLNQNFPSLAKNKLEGKYL